MKTGLRTFLWFDGGIPQVLAYYREIFGDKFVLHGQDMPDPDSDLMTADFSILGHEFIAMGWPGGPKFNDSVSLSINCDGQAEVDYYWDALTREGAAGQCGWLTDKFGLSWQVTPIQMRDYLGHPDPEKAAYAMARLREMTKIVIEDLEIRG